MSVQELTWPPKSQRCRMRPMRKGTISPMARVSAVTLAVVIRTRRAGLLLVFIATAAMRASPIFWVRMQRQRSPRIGKVRVIRSALTC